MIGYLKGTALYADERGLLLDVNGVGYEVHCPAGTLRAAREGGSFAVFVRTHVREDAIKLFGFLEAKDRDLFDRLTAIAGVGAKLALAALSCLSFDEIAMAAAAGDKAAFARVPGVGPKLAARIAGELKPLSGAHTFLAGGAAGRGSSEGEGAGTEIPASANAMADVTLALEKLGYGRSEAFRAAAEALKRNPEAAPEMLVMAALRFLSAGQGA